MERGGHSKLSVLQIVSALYFYHTALLPRAKDFEHVAELALA